MTQVGDWDELKLKELRIHELRDLARKVGVRSPTSRTKDYLIEQILNILGGKSEPYVKTSLKGRPTRSATQLNNLVDYFLPEDINKELVGSMAFSNDINNFDFFAAMPEFEFDMDSKKTQTEVEGFLDITTSGYGIIRVNGFGVSENDVYVHKIYVAKHNLQSGDYVKATAKEVYANRPMAVTAIIDVNNGAKTDLAKFDDMPKIATNNTFSLFNANIKHGSSVILLNEKPVMIDNVKQLISNIKANVNTKVVVVAPTKGDEQLQINNNGVTYVPYSITKGYLNVFSNLKLALVNAKKHAKHSDVILVISGINYLYEALRVLISEGEQNSYKIEELTKLELTKIMLSAKNINTGSLSVVLFDTIKQEQNILNFVKFYVGDACEYNLFVEDNKIEELEK